MKGYTFSNKLSFTSSLRVNQRNKNKLLTNLFTIVWKDQLLCHGSVLFSGATSAYILALGSTYEQSIDCNFRLSSGPVHIIFVTSFATKSFSSDSEHLLTEITKGEYSGVVLHFRD